MRRHIVLATQNPGKIREIRTLLVGLPFLVRPAPPAFQAEETGITFAENARLKALALARYWDNPEIPSDQAWFLADDSGLVVDALGGAPGIYSARYGGLTDPAARNEHLLMELKGVPAEHRTARFVCVIALADEIEVQFLAEGRCEGTITAAPRGRNGFGYDPLFQLAGRDRTLAELSPPEKNRVSHRGSALSRIRLFLANHLAGTAGDFEGKGDAR